MSEPTPPTPRPRALLSVYDKSGVPELGRRLAAAGWELLSSGGTARALQEAGVPVRELADLTGFGEMLGHRVVTLHPAVHGGILADRSDPDHLHDLGTHGIDPIDLVVVNLYPFSSDPSIELIDIGGPAMVRGAAKNHAHVAVVVDPADYDPVVAEIEGEGRVSDATRLRLARKAFETTCAYDAEVSAWLAGPGAGGEGPPKESGQGPGEAALPEVLELVATRREVLRYGENPHQAGARYSLPGGGWWDTSVQHGGKEMSYLNVYDADAAWTLAWSLGDLPAAVVIKHANPCGVAVAADLEAAYAAAHECDPVSAFGGIVAMNRKVTVGVARALAPVFTEVVIAPDYDEEALAVLTAKKNLRVLTATPPAAPGLHIRSISGGLLVQTPDHVGLDRGTCSVATRRAPTDSEWSDLDLAWRVAARTTSNTIVLVKDGKAVGIGAGQQNRRDAGRIAAEKAAGRAAGGACASDAFFPFRDGLDAAIEAGCTSVVQPGGSVRDAEVIAAADAAGLAMIFTGERHFRH